MRFARPLLLALVSAASVCELAVACSSVPVVRYEDLEGGTDARDQQSEQIRPQYACPNNAPPTGRCCGDKLCPNCTSDEDCQKCQAAGCQGTMANACCRRNPPQTDCKPFYDCN